VGRPAIAPPALEEGDVLASPEPESPVSPDVAPDVAVLEELYGELEGRPSRPAGHALIAGVFERLHELRFIQDLRQGASFVLRLLAEMTQARTGTVHLYDINNGRFLLVDAVGHRAAALIDSTTDESEAIVVEASRTADSVIVLDPENHPDLAKGRWALLEPQRSVVCSAVVRDGRLLGLLELVDPNDGSEFTDDDRNALSYVAGEFARFIVDRGLVLSGDADKERTSVA
jgi:signal transduction protein with GAF and PtsI domain